MALQTDVTAGGVGGGAGVQLTWEQRWLAQLDVGALFLLGNAVLTRMAVGAQAELGAYMPAAWLSFSSLWGDRIEVLRAAGRPAGIPTWSLGVRASALRFATDAEEFIVPSAARLRDPPIELDDYGVTVCSVSGTDFVPYVKLLDHFGIPYVVVTDGDASDGDDPPIPGVTRGLELLKAVGRPLDVAPEGADEEQHTLQALRKNGIFVGKKTLEVDMLNAAAGERMAEAYAQIRGRTKTSTLAPFRAAAPVSEEDGEKAVALVERLGKGRFAQRVALSMKASDVPQHINKAIAYLIRRLKP